MTKLTASAFVAQASLSVYLDNRLLIQNTESVSMELTAGEEYILHWYAEGTPGASYSISVSSPAYAQLQLTRAIGPAGKTIGHILFKA